MSKSMTQASVAKFAASIVSMIDDGAAAGVLSEDMTSIADLYHAVGIDAANGYFTRAGVPLPAECGYPCHCSYHAVCAEVSRRLYERVTMRAVVMGAGFRRGQSDARLSRISDVSGWSGVYRASYAAANPLASVAA